MYVPEALLMYVPEALWEMLFSMTDLKKYQICSFVTASSFVSGYALIPLKLFVMKMAGKIEKGRTAGRP